MSIKAKERPPWLSPRQLDAACIALSCFLLATYHFGFPLAPRLPHLQDSSDSYSDLDAVSHGHGRALLTSDSGDVATPDWATDIPRMTIFCAPKPYTGETDDPQRRALLSWVRLRPQPKVVLLGSDPSFTALAKEFPGVVSVDHRIDYNFYGVPLFHSMLARAQAADTPLSMLINGDIILLSDIMPAIGRVHAFFDQYVITAARWDVGEEFPYSFEASAWKRVRSEKEREMEIWQYVRREGSLHSYGGVDLWIWNNSPTPLFAGMPWEHRDPPARLVTRRWVSLGACVFQLCSSE